MPVPDFQTTMLPLLKEIADGKEHKMSDVSEHLANKFKLTEDERMQLLPSGRAPLFYNRIGWAKFYLKQAGLLDSPQRGTAVITPRGMEVLKQNLDKINIKFLLQYPEFAKQHNQKKDAKQSSDDDTLQTADRTPLEIMDSAYEQIRQAIVDELLEKIAALPPSFFERLVVELLVKMGYGGSIQDAGKSIGRSGDEGIDGIIKEDKLGLDVIYIQAKRWKSDNTVGREEIQKFVGALAGKKSKKGIFITTSSFTKGAWEYTQHLETKIVLIDGEKLAQLMLDHDLGVTAVTRYEIKRIDNDYFDGE